RAARFRPVPPAGPRLGQLRDVAGARGAHRASAGREPRLDRTPPGVPCGGLRDQSRRGRVTGVRCADAARRAELLSADLVVDASGRGALTLDTLRALGRPLPAQTTIGVDVMYASAIFAIPDDAPTDWKGVFTFPGVGRASRGSLMLPLEGRRWICTVGARHGDNPPGDEAGVLAFAAGAATP